MIFVKAKAKEIGLVAGGEVDGLTVLSSEVDAVGFINWIIRQQGGRIGALKKAREEIVGCRHAIREASSNAGNIGMGDSCDCDTSGVRAVGGPLVDSPRALHTGTPSRILANGS